MTFQAPTAPRPAPLHLPDAGLSQGQRRGSLTILGGAVPRISGLYRVYIINGKHINSCRGSIPTYDGYGWIWHNMAIRTITNKPNCTPQVVMCHGSNMLSISWEIKNRMGIWLGIKNYIPYIPTTVAVIEVGGWISTTKKALLRVELWIYQRVMDGWPSMKTIIGLIAGCWFHPMMSR